MLKISIPTPCHEDWNKMTPDETGRHCSVCVKSVVDFTGMSDDEVKHFFLNKKKEEKVCGRFKQTQLSKIIIELPQNILSIRMPLWKKFLAACLIVFSATLFSCETKLNGEVETKVNGQTETNEQSCSNNDITGVIMLPADTTGIAPAAPDTTSGDMPVTFPEALQGQVAFTSSTVTGTAGNELIYTKSDTAYEELIGKPVLINQPVTAKTKDPQKADPEKCNTIKNYH